MNAALHSLGRALALRDEVLIDRMMQDVVLIESPIEALPPKKVIKEQQLSMEQVSLPMKEDKIVKCT